MIYIIIGQSGAGKTTFVKKTFIKDEPTEVIKDDIYYTKAGEHLYLLGKYNVGIRTEGTDTLSYNAIEKIKQLIERITSADKDAVIVMEGDRINNSSVFDFILERYECKLYLIYCPLRTSMKRLREAGSEISEKFVKTTQTKSKNMFLKYETKMNGEVIYT